MSLADSNALGNTSGVTIANGAELDLGGGLTIGAPITSVQGAGTTGSGAIVSTGGTDALTGAITLAGGSAIGVNSGQLTLTGIINDGGTITG